MSETPSPKEFLRTLGRSWLNLLSGPASVPLSMLGLFISNQWLSRLSFALAVLLLIWTAYKMWSVERAHIVHLEKIDWRDMQRMFGGMFLNKSEFMYGGPAIQLCKQYKGVFALGQLTEGFDTIEVRAPHCSLAHIKFQFTYGRQINEEFSLCVLDGLGQQHSITDIYQTVSIRLDEKAQFRLKLVHSDDFVIHEVAELWVIVEAFQI